MANLVFVIVGKNDRPIYELDLSERKKGDTAESSMAQFLLHSALDVVDEVQWKRSELPLKVVDQYRNQVISAYVTPSNVRLLLLHPPGKNDESIKTFFSEVHELYVKVLMNPFYKVNSQITSTVFNERVRALAAKRLY